MALGLIIIASFVTSTMGTMIVKGGPVVGQIPSSNSPSATTFPPSIQWSKIYGGTGYYLARSVIQTSDGGYVLGGTTSSDIGKDIDAFLMKTDSAGNMQWNQTYGGKGDDYTFSVIQTSDGGYALAGSTTSLGAGYYNIWLIKTDSAGNMQWNQTYGYGIAASVIQTRDGGYALGGIASGGAFLIKTDSAGNMQWNQTYGGKGDGSAYSMIQTSDGGYALAGYTNSSGAGYSDFWLVKTDSNGNMQWNKPYGGTGMDVAYSVIQTSDGGYALAGSTTSFGVGFFDVWLVKTDSMGNMQWNKPYGGTGMDVAYSVIQTSDGGYALAGSTTSFGATSFNDVWLVKTDSAGNMQWDQTYGGESTDDIAYSLIQTSDGGYALGGTTVIYHNCIYLIKTSASTSISVTCSPNPAYVDSPVTCTATVYGSNPTGTVDWSTTSTTGGSFTPSSKSTLSSGSCSVTYTDKSPGPVTITASYRGDNNNPQSSGSITLTLASHLGMTISAYPSVSNVVTPNVITVPFTIDFYAHPSGGIGSYTISWIIKSDVPTFDQYNGNPLTYNFKRVGTYTIEATVSCSGSSETASAQLQISATQGRQLVTFSPILTNPYILLQYNDQPNEGVLSFGSSGVSLETGIYINTAIAGVKVPDLIMSLLGVSGPWYRITISDKAGTIDTGAEVQLNTNAPTPIHVLLPTGTPMALKDLSSYTLTFTANPRDPVAIIEDIVEAYFAAAGLGSKPDIAVKELEHAATDYLAQQYLQEITALASMPQSEQIATIHSIYDSLIDFLINLGASSVATYVLADLKLIPLVKVLQVAADLALILPGITLGTLSSDYMLQQISPMLSVTVDPNATINAEINTPVGKVGYNNGTWENTGNLSGFYHTEIMNNSYGFAIPITDQVYNANLTITSIIVGNAPYNISINWGNSTYELNGTTNGQTPQTYSLAISGANLTLQPTNPVGPLNIFNIEIIAIAAIVVAGVAVLVIVRSAKKGSIGN